jgi:hypothetical protein
MEKTVCSIINGMHADERALYSTAKLTQVRAEFERLNARWSKLKAGESFRAVVTYGRARRLVWVNLAIAPPSAFDATLSPPQTC